MPAPEPHDLSELFNVRGYCAVVTGQCIGIDGGFVLGMAD